MAAKKKATSWVGSVHAKCGVRTKSSPAPRRLVLLGAPGVGKGTQAELFSNSLGACHLSTGDIFRAAKSIPPAQRTPAMNTALEHMRQGMLVPDDTVIKVVGEQICCLHCDGGFLLDGFPRTVKQAKALDKLLAKEKLKLDAVLNYDLPLPQVIQRLGGRLICPDCRAVFHDSARKPKVDTKCDHCGALLYRRDDDQPASIRVRMETYKKSTAPLAGYYQKRGLLVTIAADGKPEEIFQRSVAALAARNGGPHHKPKSSAQKTRRPAKK